MARLFLSHSLISLIWKTVHTVMASDRVEFNPLFESRTG